VDLLFEDDAIDAIAEKAIERKTGARGLRSIVESSMMDIMFDLPSIEGAKQVIITREVIAEDKDPVIITDPKKFIKSDNNETRQITA
jgi:ATP-dependent Clp protease ATP-binding subunit ClpX